MKNVIVIVAVRICGLCHCSADSFIGLGFLFCSPKVCGIFVPESRKACSNCSRWWLSSASSMQNFMLSKLANVIYLNSRKTTQLLGKISFGRLLIYFIFFMLPIQNLISDGKLCAKEAKKKSAKSERTPSCTVVCVKPKETFVQEQTLYVIQDFQIRGTAFKSMLREIGYVSCIYLKQLFKFYQCFQKTGLRGRSLGRCTLVRL